MKFTMIVDKTKEEEVVATVHNPSALTEKLEALGVSDHDMAEIFSGSDRYAQEMLRYRLEQRDARKENEG